MLLVEDDSRCDEQRECCSKSRVTWSPPLALREALQARSNASSVDLLITDYHLAEGETGVQVIAAVRESWARQSCVGHGRHLFGGQGAA